MDRCILATNLAKTPAHHRSCISVSPREFHFWISVKRVFTCHASRQLVFQLSFSFLLPHPPRESRKSHFWVPFGSQAKPHNLQALFSSQAVSQHSAPLVLQSSCVHRSTTTIHHSQSRERCSSILACRGDIISPSLGHFFRWKDFAHEKEIASKSVPSLWVEYYTSQIN